MFDLKKKNIPQTIYVNPDGTITNDNKAGAISITLVLAKKKDKWDSVTVAFPIGHKVEQATKEGNGPQDKAVKQILFGLPIEDYDGEPIPNNHSVTFQIAVKKDKQATDAMKTSLFKAYNDARDKHNKETAASSGSGSGSGGSGSSGTGGSGGNGSGGSGGSGTGGSGGSGSGGSGSGGSDGSGTDGSGGSGSGGDGGTGDGGSGSGGDGGSGDGGSGDGSGGSSGDGGSGSGPDNNTTLHDELMRKALKGRNANSVLTNERAEQVAKDMLDIFGY